MKNLKLIGIISAISGLLIALTPHQLAPVCKGNLILKTGMEVHMKCFWTGQAAMVIGLLVLVTGLLMILAENQETVKFLAIVESLMAVALILLPQDFVIGICAKETMACHTTAFFLRIWSFLLIAITLVAMILPQSQSKNIEIQA